MFIKDGKYFHVPLAVYPVIDYINSVVFLHTTEQD